MLANARKNARGLEIIFEVRGALMIKNNISFGHIFVILLPVITCHYVCALPEACVDFGDRDEFPQFIGVRLGLGNIWENNIGQRYVVNGLGNVVAMAELWIVGDFF